MSKHISTPVIILLLALLLTGCTVSAEERTGEAQGYGGPLRVAVTMDGTAIRTIRVTEHHETEGVGTRAIEQLPQAMVNANTAEVDDVSGATVTSTALKAAVRQAISSMLPVQPEASAQPGGMAQAASVSGTGIAVTGRIGPGVDTDGKVIYSLNIVTANALFDESGRIQHLDVDQLEVASPNAADMAVFSGWPVQRSQEAGFLTEPAAWKTKRELGESYRLGSGTWAQEMDAFERLFTGMTAAEVQQWFDKNCSDVTGKPLTAGSMDDDAAKYQLLDNVSKEALADVTSAATMSLRGVNGDILTAIMRAWENAQRR